MGAEWQPCPVPLLCLDRSIHATCALGMVDMTGPLLVIKGAPLYTGVPSARAGNGGALCQVMHELRGHSACMPASNVRAPLSPMRSAPHGLLPHSLASVFMSGNRRSRIFFLGFTSASGALAKLRMQRTTG